MKVHVGKPDHACRPEFERHKAEDENHGSRSSSTQMPRVTVEKVDGRVQRIEFACTCGENTTIECVYAAKDE